MSKSGLLCIYGKKIIMLGEIERNVLQVSLDHMEEHLISISGETDVTDRLKACKELQKTIL